MRVLILGGNGFIGSAIARKFIAHKAHVTCIGRNVSRHKFAMPSATWLAVDLATLQQASQWKPLIAKIDIVINAAGVLQDSPRDNLSAVQLVSMRALYTAAKQSNVKRIIQISANTDALSKKLEFLQTKQSADFELANSGLEYNIIKPALVVGRNSHGGTALIRAVATTPFFQPITFAKSSIQTTDLDDLSDSVWQAANGEIQHKEIAIAAKKAIQLKDVILQHRNWLGLSNASVLNVPNSLTYISAKFADIAGYFGWRSPLRTTAIKILQGDVLAQPDIPLIETISLNQTLANNPSAVQDLWHARLYFLKPIVILCLAVFWIASGAIALLNPTPAIKLLSFTGFSSPSFLLYATSALDILLGVGILFRSFARTSILLMLATSISYLVAATIFLPELWLDPIGPLIKVIPSIILSLIALSILEER